jgi:hypothetical protein
MIKIRKNRIPEEQQKCQIENDAGLIIENDAGLIEPIRGR